MNDFAYLHPKNQDEASRLLSEEKTLPVAGGTDLLDLLKADIETPETLVNLKSLSGLNAINYSPGKGLRIGALVTLAELIEHPIVQEKYSVLAQAAREVGTPQLRNIGTIGGNLCQRPRCMYFRGDFDCLRKGGDTCFAVDGHNKYHCVIAGSPCFIVHPSDTAVALLALNASVVITKKKKSRTINLQNFFVLPKQNVLAETILEPGEIVTEIQIPEPSANTVSGYLKFKERDAWDFAVVSVASVLEKNNSRIHSGRVTLGGVAPTPWYEEEVSRRLENATLSETNIEELVQYALTKAEPLEMNSYKLPLARNLIKRSLLSLS
ncbi:xanthine dehydrogenase family protein subunit M [bacterium]|nr:xanthine dehydrogenase family protein subunit M [bacterium]